MKFPMLRNTVGFVQDGENGIEVVRFISILI